MQHNLKFGGFFLNQFLSQCTFVNEKTVKYKYLEEKETTLNYTKLSAIELKILVKSVAKHLKQEVSSIIPGNTNFFKNFSIFNFEEIINLKGNDLSNYGNKEINTLADYYFSRNL